MHTRFSFMSTYLEFILYGSQTRESGEKMEQSKTLSQTNAGTEVGSTNVYSSTGLIYTGNLGKTLH